MELDNIKRNTTWNDASESINSNFSKIRQELLRLGNKEGLTEAELEEFLTSHGYTKEEWVLAQNLLLEERIENLEQEGGAVNVEGSAFISVSQDGVISLDVDAQGGLGRTEQGLGIVSIPSELLKDIKIDVDSAMSDTSENAVQNKVVKQYVDQLRADFDAIVNGDASAAIESINEILAFLSTIEDTTTLEGIIAGLKASMEKYTDEEVAHIEGVLNERIDGIVHVVYYYDGLSEEHKAENKKAYDAIMAGNDSCYVITDKTSSTKIIATAALKSSTIAGLMAYQMMPTSKDEITIGILSLSLYEDGSTAQTTTQSYVLNREAVIALLSGKQDVLVSGTTIKTINGQDILGEGDITIEVGEGSEGSQKTYVFYLDEELTEEKIEANKSFYEAAISEIPASYVVSSYGVIAIPTMVAGSQDSVIIGITTNDEIADSEARDREYLDVRNLQIELVEDGTFALHKQFDSRLAKVSMLDEVIAKVDEIPDIVANLPQGEKFYYVHIPFEDAPLDEEQLAENAASCTKWLEAKSNNEPLPILCWSAFPYGDGRMYVYDSSDGLLNFSIRMTLGVGNDESLDNAELVGMLIVDGLLYSTGEVELYMPLEEKVLPTINSFKTINGQSIFGEGDIEIQGGNGGGAEVRTLFVNDAGLSADELSYNAETVQLIFAQHPMIFFASAEEGTPLSEYELMGMDNGRMVFAKYELNEFSTGATYIYLAMDGSTEVGGFSKSELDGDKYDSSLDTDSTNAVQNKVVTENIRALEATMPLMAVIDLDTIIAQDTPIDNATRNALLELGGYTSGDKYFSKGWVWSQGYLYTVKVIPTESGVQIQLFSFKGWTEIAEDNSKVNHLPSQGGASVEVDAELSETSENAVSNKAVTMALAETEEVTAAALNELNKRFDDYATKEDMDATLAEMDDEINHIEGVLEATIIEDEEVTAAALNDLDKRVTSLEQNGGGGGGGDIYNVSFTIDPSTMELVMAYDVQPTFDFTLDENGNLIAII